MTSTSQKNQTKIIANLAHKIARDILSLPEGSTPEQILNVFANLKQQPAKLAEAFQMLDQEPSKFADHRKWHHQLRRLRNCPENGSKLFAMFA